MPAIISIQFFFGQVNMKFKLWGITLTIITVTLATLFYLKQSVLAQNADQGNYEPAATIEATKAGFIAYQPTHSVTGHSVAVNQMTLQNELTGKITRLNMRSGQQVKQGQVLLELDHSQEQAQLAAAKATARLKSQTAKRYQSLFQQQRISADQLDTATAESAVANAEVAQVKTIIAKKIIRAPFDAIVGIHDLTLGQQLAANSSITELIGINDFIWVDFNIPQVYPELLIGSEVTVSLSGQQKQQADAELVAVSPLLSRGSRQLKYRAKIMRKSLALKPNHLVKVSFPIAANRQVITVPELSITRDQLGEYVYELTAQDDGSYRANRRNVVLGARVNNRIIIEQGLALNDIVATKGAFKLREGMKTHFDVKTIGL